MANITIDESKLVKVPPMTDKTGKELAAQMGKLVLAVEAQSGKKVSEVSDWEQVASMVRSGTAVGAFPVNTKFTEKWTDVTTGATREYDDRVRVVHHGPANVRGKGACDAMWLQQVYAMPMGTQFDAYEAFYAAPAGGLDAGTYNIIAGVKCGKLEANKSYQFTLTQPLSEGGQLAFASSPGDYVPSAVNAYKTKGAATAQESVSVTVGGTAGTNLGTMTTNAVDESGNVNHIHRVCYGSNRWATSALRQWLNSDKPAGQWWAPKTKWDRPPTYATTMAGYLAGFSKDFVDRMAWVEVKTALATCDGGTSSGTQCDTTWDRVFLPSAEQLYWGCTWLGVPYGLEGTAWEYYKELYPNASPASMGATHTEFIMTYMGSESSACYVFERSAHRGTGNAVALCYSDGGLGTSHAYHGNRVAPACCIC